MKRKRGYWLIKENAKEELRPIVEELGYIPSLPVIKQIDSALAKSLNRYYPMEEVYSWFGKEDEYKARKPAGYWNDKLNIFHEFEKILQELGYIPSANELIKMGHQDLVSALSRHKLKLTDIRTKYGLGKDNKKSRSKYDDYEVVSKEVKEFIDKFMKNHQRVPTTDDFKSSNKDYLLKAIFRTHKTTYNKVLEQLGFTVNKKENDYWKQEKNILKEANIIFDEYGYLPSPRKLAADNKYQSFCVAVNKYYGGFHKLREALGMKQLKRKKGFWMDKESILDEFLDIIDKYGFIPTHLAANGYGHLPHAVQHYGGIYAFAIEHNLPLQNTRVSKNYYDDEERFKNKVNELINQFNDFPSHTELIHIGEWSILYRLVDKYGSVANASEVYGYTKNIIISIDGDRCDSFSERIVDDYLFCCHIPHERNIRLQLGKTTVIPDFVLSLPQKVVIEVLMCDYREPTEYDVYKEYIKRYLEKKEAYNDEGYEVIEVFPEDLKNKKLLDQKLYDQVKRFSTSENKDLSKVPLTYKDKRPPGYWKIFDNLKNELLPHCIKLGRMPRLKELKKVGLGHIDTVARQYHGGLSKVAEKLGYSYPPKNLKMD